jgi:hypothetical protein
VEAAVDPIGDPDETGDFAEEHESTEVDADDADTGETESPEPYAGGLEADGPP